MKKAFLLFSSFCMMGILVACSNYTPHKDNNTGVITPVKQKQIWDEVGIRASGKRLAITRNGGYLDMKNIYHIPNSDGSEITYTLPEGSTLLATIPETQRFSNYYLYKDKVYGIGNRQYNEAMDEEYHAFLADREKDSSRYHPYTLDNEEFVFSGADGDWEPINYVDFVIEAKDLNHDYQEPCIPLLSIKTNRHTVFSALGEELITLPEQYDVKDIVSVMTYGGAYDYMFQYYIFFMNDQNVLFYLKEFDHSYYGIHCPSIETFKKNVSARLTDIHKASPIKDIQFVDENMWVLCENNDFIVLEQLIPVDIEELHKANVEKFHPGEVDWEE